MGTSLNYVNEKPLSIITFSPEDIGKIIRNLNPNKVHGHENISILMLKICGNTICKLLEIIFKQNLKNYRPVSQLSICGKIFERLIFNQMFKFFLENKLITSHQFGFKPADSCIKQLLSITQNIYKSFHD